MANNNSSSNSNTVATEVNMTTTGFKVNTLLSSHGYSAINPAALSDSEFKQWSKIVELINGNRLNINNFSTAFERQVGYKFTVTLEDLFYSWENEEFSQYSVQPKLVMNILCSPTDGLLLGNKLVRHIEFGFADENVDAKGKIKDTSLGIISGGRHRLTAILTWLFVSELWERQLDATTLSNSELQVLAKEILEDPDFLALEVPVSPVLYSLQAVRASNLSRRMDASENNLIGLQLQGVGTNLMDIAVAVSNKVIKPGKGIPAMFALLSESSDAVTTLTASQVGTSLVSYLSKSKFKYPTTPNGLVSFVTKVWERVPGEVSQLRKQGITNISRDGRGFLVINLGGFILSNGAKLWLSEEETQLAEKEKTQTGKTTTKRGSTKTTNAKNKTSTSSTKSKLKRQVEVEDDFVGDLHDGLLG